MQGHGALHLANQLPGLACSRNSGEISHSHSNRSRSQCAGSGAAKKVRWIQLAVCISGPRDLEVDACGQRPARLPVEASRQAELDHAR
jgi:hypothetical protein